MCCWWPVISDKQTSGRVTISISFLNRVFLWCVCFMYFWNGHWLCCWPVTFYNVFEILFLPCIVSAKRILDKENVKKHIKDIQNNQNDLSFLSSLVKISIMSEALILFLVGDPRTLTFQLCIGTNKYPWSCIREEKRKKNFRVYKETFFCYNCILICIRDTTHNYWELSTQYYDVV